MTYRTRTDLSAQQLKRVRKRDKLYRRELRKQQPEKVRGQLQKYRIKLKTQVVLAYGGACVGCNETDLSCLTIDHIDNNGANERRALAKAWGWKNQMGIGGAPFYRKLRNEGWPKHNYRLLCMNCQFRARVGDVLPVQKVDGLNTPSYPALERLGFSASETSDLITEMETAISLAFKKLPSLVNAPPANTRSRSPFNAKA